MKAPSDNLLIVKILKVVAICFVGLLVISIVGSFATYLVLSQKQKNEYANAQERCGKDPYVIVESEDILFGGGHSYYFYTPESPFYDSNKTTFSSVINFSSVYGYYCSIDEARNSPVGDRLKDAESNYSVETQSQLIADYLSKLKLEGSVIYEPNLSGTEYEFTSKELYVFNDTYELVVNNKNPNESAEQPVMTVVCSKSDTREATEPPTVIGINSEGNEIFYDYDTLSTFSYVTKLSAFTCRLEFNSVLTSIDAYNLAVSMSPASPSSAATYTLGINNVRQ